ncbi:hypothetical protein PPUN12996_03920 [Pseudomonas putida]|nr:hypothetical protein KAM380_059270 [Aeromonas caviae]GLO28336.1 hypothetical protein PPUN12996_03920 [Pseudomonas putida]
MVGPRQVDVWDCVNATAFTQALETNDKAFYLWRRVYAIANTRCSGSKTDAHVEHNAAAQVAAQEVRRIGVGEQHPGKCRPDQ